MPEPPALNTLVSEPDLSMDQQLVSYTQDHPPSSSWAPVLLQVAGADMAGQEPKASMPTGGGAGLCSTTCLGTCRSNPRASTSSIRWIEHQGVRLGVGPG